MSRPTQESPYRDDQPVRSHPHRSRESSSAAHRSHRPLRKRAAHEPVRTDSDTPKRRSSRRRGRRAGAYAAPAQLTSHSTSRTAYVETRVWLLEQHGPVCAYCGGRFTERTMTLDHVAPRKGLTAYDRRDNLVLACRACNEAKRDLAPLAFLLAARNRAVNLLRYGAHLSPMLLNLARSLVPAGAEIPEPEPAPKPRRKTAVRIVDADDDGESPYKD